MDEKKIQDLYKQVTDGDMSQRDFERAIGKIKQEMEGTPTNKNSGTTTGGTEKSAEGIFAKLLKGSLEQTASPESQIDLGTILSEYKNIRSQQGDDGDIITALGKTIGNVAANSIEEYAKQSSFLLNELNASVGLTGQLSKDFRDAVREGQPDLERLGLTFKDISDAAGQLVESTGRFTLVGTDMLVRAGEIAKAYGMNMSDVTEAYFDFEKVGIGAAEAQESIADAGARSLELGLQSRQTIEGMIDNISKLNEYGFKDGQDGLAEMVRTATRLRFSLESTFRVADQVFEPEGALDLAANLQVLGAAFGDFNDPLRLMYMATNEVEGLQEALAGVSQNLAVYNQETGNFEVTGTNLRMARDIAKQFGIDIKEVTNSAIAAQERAQAALALDGLNIDDDNKEFLTNLSRMKDGEMQIELLTPELQREFKGTTIKLSELNNEQALKLKEYQDEFTQMSESDIVRQQATTVENISRDLKYMIALTRLEVADVGDTALKQFVGMDFKDLGTYLSGEEGAQGVTDKVAEIIKTQGQNLKDLIGSVNPTNDGQTNNSSTQTVNVTHTHTASNNTVMKMAKMEGDIKNATMTDRDLNRTRIVR
jgi:hypothetical protein